MAGAELHTPVRVRDAEPKWGCAYKRCLSKARFVVVTAEGNEWGACRTHLKEVRRAAEAE